MGKDVEIIVERFNKRTGIPRTLQTGLHHAEQLSHKSDEGSFEHRKKTIVVSHHPLHTKVLVTVQEVVKEVLILFVLFFR